MATNKHRIMFNANNGELIGALPPGTDTFGFDPNQVKIKTVKYDPETEVYIGTYDNGKIEKIKNLEKNPDAVYIDEEMLNEELKADLVHVYPVHRQLNIIIDMLNNSDIPNTPEFAEMCNFIKDLRDKNKVRKEAFKNNPNSYVFVSKEDIQKNRRKRLGLD